MQNIKQEDIDALPSTFAQVTAGMDIKLEIGHR